MSFDHCLLKCPLREGPEKAVESVEGPFTKDLRVNWEVSPHNIAKLIGNSDKIERGYFAFFIVHRGSFSMKHLFLYSKI